MKWRIYLVSSLVGWQCGRQTCAHGVKKKNYLGQLPLWSWPSLSSFSLWSGCSRCKNHWVTWIWPWLICIGRCCIDENTPVVQKHVSLWRIVTYFAAIVTFNHMSLSINFSDWYACVVSCEDPLFYVMIYKSLERVQNLTRRDLWAYNPTRLNNSEFLIL